MRYVIRVCGDEASSMCTCTQKDFISRCNQNHRCVHVHACMLLISSRTASACSLDLSPPFCYLLENQWECHSAECANRDSEGGKCSPQSDRAIGKLRCLTILMVNGTSLRTMEVGWWWPAKIAAERPQSLCILYRRIQNRTNKNAPHNILKASTESKSNISRTR